MECRIEDLRCMEVVNICDGSRLGFVSDVMIEIAGGGVTALIVPGRCRLLGLFWREDDYILPWESIRRIGGDIILVENQGEYRREKRGRRRWFTWSGDSEKNSRSSVEKPEEP